MNLEQERARFEKAYQNAGIGSDEPDPLVPDDEGSYKKVVPAFMWKGWLLYAASESKTSYAWQSGYSQAKEEEALANLHLVPPERQEDCPLCGRKIARCVVGSTPPSTKTNRVAKQEVIECPICRGKLHLSQAAYNGHVWGGCETEGCVSWMQ